MFRIQADQIDSDNENLFEKINVCKLALSQNFPMEVSFAKI